VTGQEISAAEGIAAKIAATGAPDRVGVSDNGSTLGQLAKTVRKLGASARYPLDWQDALQAAKKGAAIIINVQAAKGYPEQALSKWHRSWAKYWAKKEPAKVAAGYGHMITVAHDPVIGWQLADPTMNGKGAERYAAAVTVQDVRAVAESKGDAAHRRMLLVERREK
jgi:hypothetical protein